MSSLRLQRRVISAPLAKSCLVDFAVATTGQTAYGLTSRRMVTGTSQVAQWFRLHTCNARAQVQTLIREIRIPHVSPGSLDSSLSFIQPGISHDILCI